MTFEPLRVTGVVTERVGTPRNDGTPGSALYEVPLQLSTTPSRYWSEVFVATFNRPPSYTSMHRPGIASVHGDTILLDGTTIEEVEKYHLQTVKLAVEAANVAERDRLGRDEAAAAKRREDEEEHRRSVRDVVDRLDFD